MLQLFVLVLVFTFGIIIIIAIAIAIVIDQCNDNGIVIIIVIEDTNTTGKYLKALTGPIFVTRLSPTISTRGIFPTFIPRRNAGLHTCRNRGWMSPITKDICWPIARVVASSKQSRTLPWRIFCPTALCPPPPRLLQPRRLLMPRKYSISVSVSLRLMVRARAVCVCKSISDPPFIPFFCACLPAFPCQIFVTPLCSRIVFTRTRMLLFSNSNSGVVFRYVVTTTKTEHERRNQYSCFHTSSSCI
jgi:hypothetical protein